MTRRRRPGPAISPQVAQGATTRYQRCLAVARQYGAELVGVSAAQRTEIVGEIATSVRCDEGCYDDELQDRYLPDAWEAFYQAQTEQERRDRDDR